MAQTHPLAGQSAGRCTDDEIKSLPCSCRRSFIPISLVNLTQCKDEHPFTCLRGAGRRDRPTGCCRMLPGRVASSCLHCWNVLSQSSVCLCNYNQCSHLQMTSTDDTSTWILCALQAQGRAAGFLDSVRIDKMIDKVRMLCRFNLLFGFL